MSAIDLRDHIHEENGTWQDAGALAKDSFRFTLADTRRADRFLLRWEGDGVLLVGPLRVRVTFQTENVTSYLALRAPLASEVAIHGGEAYKEQDLQDMVEQSRTTGAPTLHASTVYSYTLDIPAGHAWKYEHLATSTGGTGNAAGGRVLIEPAGLDTIATPVAAGDMPCNLAVADYPEMSSFFPAACEPCEPGAQVRMPPLAPALFAPSADGGCVRTRFFDGMSITKEDLETEQRYLRIKNRLHNRTVGQGVVWGLNVGKQAEQICVLPGYAIDCCGNDLTVTTVYKVDIAALLRDPAAAAACAKATAGTPQRMHLLLEHVECPSEPRPVHGDPCGPPQQVCEPSRTRETVRLRLVPPRDYQADGPLRRFLDEIAKLEEFPEIARLMKDPQIARLLGTVPMGEVRAVEPGTLGLESPTWPCFSAACSTNGEPLFPVPPPWLYVDPTKSNTLRGLAQKIVYQLLRSPQIDRYRPGLGLLAETATHHFVRAIDAIQVKINAEAQQTLISQLKRLLRDLCASLLYPGPQCREEPHGVVIGCVTVSGGSISSVEPWGGRRYVMQYPLLAHWGEQLGIVAPDVLASRFMTLACCLGDHLGDHPGELSEVYLKASNPAEDDLFGVSVSLYGDTLAVGASGESDNRGAVHVFSKEGGTWKEQECLTVPNAGEHGGFGVSVSLYGDTLAVGASGESDNRGAVYVFSKEGGTKEGGTWKEQECLTASDAAEDDLFGISVSLYGDTLAVGCPGQDNNTGSVHLFRRKGSTWTLITFSSYSTLTRVGQSASLSGEEGVVLAVGARDDANNSGTVVLVGLGGDVGPIPWQHLKADMGGSFGTSVSLYGDTLAVGAFGESDNSGAVHVFSEVGGTWKKQAYLKVFNPRANDYFGSSVSLYSDTLAVGAPGEASGDPGNADDVTAQSSGAVYVFRKEGKTWKEQTYLKASNLGEYDFFGSSVSLYADTLAVGAIGEASKNPTDPANDLATNSGAVYVYE